MKRRAFFIDVSRRQPFVVQPARGRELPLASLTDAQLHQLCDLAAGQLRRGVVEDHDSVAEYRATLYFLQRFSAMNDGQPTASTDRDARSRSRNVKRSAGATRSA